MMGAHARSAARRSVAARAAVAVALATVAATVLVGVGVAQEAAQVPTAEPSAEGLAVPAPPPPTLTTSLPQLAESRAPRTAAAPEPSAPRTVAPATATREAVSESTAPASAAPPAGPASSTLVEGTPCTSTARACVDLDERKAWLIDAGKVVRGPVNVGIGEPDEPTPTGTFHVQWKAEQYTSREFLVEMPYSVFFADGGIAFHEGEPDLRSAGCVKLKHDDAVAWFNFLQVDDEVQVR